jgi:3-methylcrotonyl-CoA carboxylase beta subunit
MLAEIEARYERATTPEYAAARLWVDELIDPRDTREWLALGLEVAALNPDVPRFNPGVIQT